MLQLGAWVVGSAASFIEIGNGNPADIDILVPPDQWAKACTLLARERELVINRFGGFKVRIDGTSVDFWPDHLEHYAESTLNFGDSGLAIRLYPPARVEFSRPKDT